MTGTRDVTTLFLAGARTVAEAIADPAVEVSWDRPSVLEHQLVGGVAGHLARSGVWVTDEYLRGPTPSGPPDFRSAAAYFYAVAVSVGPEVHQAVRDRGAATAALGRKEVLSRVDEHLGRLEAELPGLPGAQLVAVVGGRVMALSDYLVTRIVEQAVHLDDLARSVGRQTWALPDGHEAIAIEVGSEMACRLHGPTATVRALYRKGFAGAVFPVL
jgi:Mycothiol maleylpyruvate isomerase N-terminal domain